LVFDPRLAVVYSAERRISMLKPSRILFSFSALLVCCLSVFAQTGVHVNGARDRAYNVTIDGIEANDS
jgi:hypothetical protein